MWQRTREGDEAPRPLVGKAVQQLVWVLVVATVLLIAVGTVVTGSGPHAGDSSEIERMPLDWENVSKLHAVLAWIVVTLTFALWFVLKAVDAPKGPLDRTRDLFLILLAQGVIGYVQYFTNLPEVLVGLHMLGSALVWIAVLRVLLALRERPGTASRRPTCPAPRPRRRSPRARKPKSGRTRARASRFRTTTRHAYEVTRRSIAPPR